jgi:hypothetical protein
VIIKPGPDIGGILCVGTITALILLFVYDFGYSHGREDSRNLWREAYKSDLQKYMGLEPANE